MNELQNNSLGSAALTPLAAEVKQLITQSRRQVAVQVNSAITLLYWNVGKRIRQEILKEQRAEYGKQILANLSRELTLAFGKGWGEQQLRHCVRCAEVFADEQILYTLCIELSWSHIRTLMFVEDTLKRDFYIEMCRMEHWSVRQLNERIDSMLYERTEGENSPMGILLCAEKSDNLVELLELNSSGIHVAQYLTELPEKKVLEEQLKKSIQMAKEKFL